MGAAEDLKATTGIYDASLGGRSNETSGVAIQKRNVQAQTSNFHFVDNLTRSMKHTGRILVDLIPKIYDTARAQRIIGEDGEQKIVQLNQPTGTPDVELGKDGKPLLYQLDAGKYDVTMDVGPSFETKRQEAAASMIEVSKANPQIMAVAGDLLVKNMDWPGAQEVAERLKKTLPPGLADDPNQKQNPIPPQAQAQMQQMGQMIEQQTAKLHELMDERDQKLVEIESRERIEFKKLEVQLELKRAELDAKDSLALLTHEIASINQRMALLNIEQPIDDEGAEAQPGQPSPMPPAPAGAPGAGPDPGGPQPTGGFPPGQPAPEGVPQ